VAGATSLRWDFAMISGPPEMNCSNNNTNGGKLYLEIEAGRPCPCRKPHLAGG
jgi:hypothetical protein